MMHSVGVGLHNRPLAETGLPQSFQSRVILRQTLSVHSLTEEWMNSFGSFLIHSVQILVSLTWNFC